MAFHSYKFKLLTAASFGLTVFIVALLLRSTPSPRVQQVSQGPDRMRSIPHIVLWAWERPENLAFVDPKRAAVAFLAETILLRGDDVSARPRFQPLRVAGETKLIAVTRIEVDKGTSLNRAQLENSIAAIVKTSLLPRVAAVQVDFDARRSQRRFYRALLVALRQRLPAALPISITALASWCLNAGDGWISGLPIDEAVPMLFRMGVGTREVTERLASGQDFRWPACQGSLGISTDEPWARLPSGRRLYIFHPAPWTRQAEAQALWEASWR